MQAPDSARSTPRYPTANHHMTLPEITVEQIMAIFGAIGTIASVLGTVLPKHWPITQLLTKYFADPRGVRKAPTQLREPEPTETLRRAYSREDELTPTEPAIARRKSDPPPPE